MSFGGGGFSFGGSQPATGGFSFGTPTTAAAPAAAPAFGQPSVSFAANPVSFSTAAAPISFGASPAAAPAPASTGFTSLSFGGGGGGGLMTSGGGATTTTTTGTAQPQQQNPSLSLFSSPSSFAAPAAQSQPTSFTNAPVTSGTTGFAAPTAQPAALNFGTSAPPAQPAAAATTTGIWGLGGFQIPTSTPAAATSVSSGFAAAASVPNTLFSGGLGSSSTASVAPTASSTTQPSTLTTAATSVTSGTSSTTTTTSSTANPAGTTAPLTQMSFRQLQELINKWTVELGEEEKSFIEQATKVNAWDKTVMANGEKIAVLDDAVSKVKSEHSRLENTLEYLKTQQQEFEAFLEPLEASLPATISADPDRENLYTLAENMDTSLQQMAEDLKEIIRHINDSNKTADKADPVSQILKILNEHTDALQWVEDNSNGVKKSLEEVSKMHQMFRQDHERSLRLTFQH